MATELGPSRQVIGASESTECSDADRRIICSNGYIL